MVVDERTALLNAYNSNGGCHIVLVPKDIVDYEPISSSEEYSFGLSLEELLPYKDDPWWLNVRRTLFCSFWLTFVFTLLAACLLSYMQMGNCRTYAGNVSFSTVISSTATTNELVTDALTFSLSESAS